MGFHPPRTAHIQSSDPLEFTDRLEAFARGPVRLDPVRARGFRARARAWGLPRIGLFKVRIDGARVFSPPRPGVLSLTATLEGAFEERSGSAAKSFEPGTCFARDDADALDLDIPGASMLVANVDAHLLRETARKLSDADPPRPDELESCISLATPEGALLWGRLAALWRDLGKEPPVLASPRAIADAEAGLAEALAGAVRAGAAARVSDCGAACLRRAEDFILAHLCDRISRADICAAAGASARSLSRQFARRHGVGPMTFLKQRRLEAAQRSLVAAHPAEKSVTDVALEWGQDHLGRFSVEYRAAFGESPSQTLAR